jgi:hypothetical protein
METVDTRSFDALVAKFLGTRLPDRLADGIRFAELPTDTRRIILRMLALMKRSSFPATEINSQMLWLLATVTPAMLPPAWGGRIPPLTSPGRHKKLDAYVAQRIRPPGNGPPVFVDAGCGFPPVTTIDTATSIPTWSVVGVDRSFASYVLYDPQGNYACFDREGVFLYQQLAKQPLHDNPKAVRERFEALFAALSPDIRPIHGDASHAVEKDDWRLVFNPIRDFETRNLTFIESDIGGLRLPTASVVRCMNVLLYFDQRDRRALRASLAGLLEDGGLLISGFNHPFGTYARYTVHKKGANETRPCEFAFSPDNLKPLGIGPWVTINGADEDAELLADLTGAIRRDRRFWSEFESAVDDLRENCGICTRDRDGFIRFTAQARTASPQEMLQQTSALWERLDREGYTDGAVASLRRAGYRSWKNATGDIAIEPPEDALPAI